MFLFILIFAIIFSVRGDLAIDSYNRAFYVVNEGVGYYVVDTQNRQKPDRGQFWRTCEQIEMIEDAYEKTKNPIYKGMIGELINGLNNIVSGTQDWSSWNIYNDDIMWGVISLVRSFQLTGNKDHLSQAEIQFNKVWARGWDSEKGGLYWNTQKLTKNACVNGPAAIAGFLLAESTTNTGFKEQAKQAYTWNFNTLFNKTNGQIADHINNDGTLVWWAFTYNQGTFIGSSFLFSQATGDNSFMSHAQNAAEWSKFHLTGQHIPNILNDEDTSRDGDAVGFKGIFARWLNKYLKISGNPELRQWLNSNAQVAWQYRNSNGVTWTQWWHRTPDDMVTSWECSSAVAILEACDNCTE